MSPNDEKLQKQIENGQVPDGEGLDASAYREVFRVLRKDTAYQLPPGFAERVAATARQRQAGYGKDYFWFGAGIFFLLLSSIVTVLFTGFQLDLGFLRVMADYRGLVVFGIAFIALLNLLDKRFVRSKHVPEEH